MEFLHFLNLFLTDFAVNAKSCVNSNVFFACIKKAATPEPSSITTPISIFFFNETRGSRTPDNLIKSQVLYQLS